MSFLQRIGNAIARFMYGRNGADHLGMALIWTGLIANVVASFTGSDLVYGIMSLLSSAVVFVAMFRMFSKNLQKRRAENAWFLQKIWWPISRRFGARKRQLQDKEHKYFTCPNCKTVCRVPGGKGTIVITCPKCRSEIRGKS